jgi:hypothetical protein
MLNATPRVRYRGNDDGQGIVILYVVNHTELSRRPRGDIYGGMRLAAGRNISSLSLFRFFSFRTEQHRKLGIIAT